MGRSVVLAGAARCPRCSLQPRWCVCDALPPVATRLRFHVLIHRHEHGKPSSTGRLVARAVQGAACHVYQRATLLSRGRREMAERYLGHSPLLAAAPHVVDRLLAGRERGSVANG